jgi:hypothetical protein
LGGEYNDHYLNGRLIHVRYASACRDLADLAADLRRSSQIRKEISVHLHKSAAKIG